MAVEDPPRREPRPGDPFATPRPAPAPSRPRKKRRKGRTFFLILLVAGGVLGLGSLILFLKGRGMIVEFYEEVVVPRGIPDALPPDYPRADAEHLVRTLHGFFARADAGEASDDAVLAMITAIEEAMRDDRITPEEARGLLALAGPAPETGPEAGP